METTCEEFLQVTDHNRVSASSEINIQPVLRWPTQNVIEAYLSLIADVILRVAPSATQWGDRGPSTTHPYILLTDEKDYQLIIAAAAMRLRRDTRRKRDLEHPPIAWRAPFPGSVSAMGIRRSPLYRASDISTTNVTNVGTANSAEEEDCDEYLENVYDRLFLMGLDLYPATTPTTSRNSCRRDI